MLNVFISYSHNNDDLPLLDKLLTHLSHLSQGDAPLIKTWDDTDIPPGADWDDEIRENLAMADIVLLLISADFNNSKYIREVELENAIARHEMGTCRVVPIWIRPCGFSDAYKHLEMLPKTPDDQKLVAVTSWPNQDAAFTTIANRLRALIEEIHSTASPHPAPRPAPAPQPQFDYPWHRFFSQSALKEEAKISLLDTVNCDRTQHYNTELRTHFKASAANPENLAYLLSACPTQKPESLARRLIYFFGEKEFTFFPTEHADSDEVYTPELVFEASEEGTWKNFAAAIEHRFLPKGTDWTSFVQDPEPIMVNHKRVAFTVHINRKWWNDYDVADHIGYILDKFQALPPTCRKFVFFFVCSFPDLNEAADDHCEDYLCLLAHLEQGGNTTVRHIQKLPPVKIQDVKNWVDSIAQPHQVDTFLSQLQKAIPPTKRKKYQAEKLLDMDAVETMQYAAYTYLRDQKTGKT